MRSKADIDLARPLLEGIAHASACLVRLIQEVLAVAGLALGIVVYRRDDRLHQDVTAWHRHADMLGPSACPS
jgi:hypothetical protein